MKLHLSSRNIARLGSLAYALVMIAICAFMIALFTFIVSFASSEARGAEPPVWNPAVAAGCAGFWVADDWSGSGAWASRCNGGSLTPEGSTSLVTDAMGTHSAARMDGSTGYFLDNQIVQASVVIALVRVNQNAADYALLGAPSGATYGGYYYYLMDPPEGGIEVAVLYNGSSFAQVAGGNVYYPFTNRFWLFSGSYDTTGGNLTVSASSNMQAASTSSVGAATVTAADGDLAVGVVYGDRDPVNYCDCDIVALWVGTNTPENTPISAIQEWMVQSFMGPDSTFSGLGFNSVTPNYTFTMSAQTTAGTWGALGWSDDDAVRDPDLRYVPATGKWWRGSTATSGGDGAGTGFDLAWSYDRKIWNFSQSVTCEGGTPGTDFSCWAPGLFVDATGGLHAVVAWDQTHSDSDHILEETHPTTSDPGSTWSAPVALASSGWPANAIDPWIFQVGATLHMLFKDETTKYIDHAICTDSSITFVNCFDGTNSWSVIQTGTSMGLPQYFEGPFTLPQPSGLLRVFVDGTPGYGQGYWWSDCQWSGASLVNCTTPTALTTPSPFAGYNNSGYWQHGTGYLTPQTSYIFAQ